MATLDKTLIDRINRDTNFIAQCPGLSRMDSAPANTTEPYCEALRTTAGVGLLTPISTKADHLVDYSYTFNLYGRGRNAVRKAGEALMDVIDALDDQLIFDEGEGITFLKQTDLVIDELDSNPKRYVATVIYLALTSRETIR